MSQSIKHPSVAAVMLTFDPARVEYARKAVARFNSQNYSASIMRLIIYDSREKWRGAGNPTVGQLRNEANRLADEDIIIHLDDDDWSHASRFKEQVQLLQSSGADVVGYNECLFWREKVRCICPGDGVTINPTCPGDDPWDEGEAWLYTSGSKNEAIGSSLAYWRSTWERKPFQPTSQGEDAAFQIGLKVATVSAIQSSIGRYFQDTGGRIMQNVTGEGPRLLCRIHGGNTSNAYTAENMRAAEWRRVKEWDDYCRAEFAK